MDTDPASAGVGEAGIYIFLNGTVRFDQVYGCVLGNFIFIVTGTVNNVAGIDNEEKAENQGQNRKNIKGSFISPWLCSHFFNSIICMFSLSFMDFYVHSIIIYFNTKERI